MPVVSGNMRSGGRAEHHRLRATGKSGVPEAPQDADAACLSSSPDAKSTKLTGKNVSKGCPCPMKAKLPLKSHSLRNMAVSKTSSIYNQNDYLLRLGIHSMLKKTYKVLCSISHHV